MMTSPGKSMKWKVSTILEGDFDARTYERLEHDKEVVGSNITGRKEYTNNQGKGKGINENMREDSDLFIDF
jgi:hypothetical protein